MTKMRVHELAKELGIENRDLMEQLREKNIDVKSHMSSLEEDVVEAFRKAAAKQTAQPSEAKDGEAPKKKKLVQVFRPQNLKNSGKAGKRPQGQRPANPMNKRTPNPAAQQSAAARPAAQNQAQRPAGDAPEPKQEKVQEQRPQTNSAEQAQNNQNVQNSQNQSNNRPAAERQNSTSRPAAQNRDSRNGDFRNNDSRNTDRRNQNNRPGSRNQNGGYRSQQGDNNRPNRPNGEDSRQRNGRFQGRTDDRKDGRDGRRDFKDGHRDNRDGRRDSRRDDRSSIPAPAVPEQKPSRNKTKDKEKDYKKKENLDEDFKGGRKGKGQKGAAELKKPQKPQQKPEPKKEEVIKQIVIPQSLTIQELAEKMKIAPSVIIKKLFMQGKVVTLNQEVDYDTAEEIAMEFEVLCEPEKVVDVIEELLKEDEEDEKDMVKRPPVVCVMGHVDHGKTSLLDAIRDTNVTDREAGGITQHIGASVVTVNGEKITFLDTPGHEAFTAMRMRGANSTDIAILVVAADDGVMPQTVEAINHAKAAGIEIVVAINKIDKPNANIERVKQELTEYELIPEDWGGSTVFVPVSAHTKEGIPELMEMLLLTAEMLELKANPNRKARGLVIEGELDKGKGSVARVLVQKGTLHVGDSIAAGSAHGKVRAMMDDKGRRVKEAGPSMPVEILGLNDVPNAGEVFVACENDKEARAFADTFIAQNKVKLLEETKSKMSLDDLFNQIQEGNLKELNIVVKADVQGSVEALKQSLLKLSNDEVVIKIIHGGVGAINESDVTLASASNAIIIGFNVRPDATAKETADREGVDVRLYRVIYNAIEDVEAAMKGMLDPVFEEKVLGHAEVRQTFKASGVGTIAGAYVLDGVFERNCSVRLVRDGIVIYDGSLASLKRFKDDVKEVRAGYECGFVFDNYNDIKEGDQVEAYKMVEIER